MIGPSIGAVAASGSSQASTSTAKASPSQVPRCLPAPRCPRVLRCLSGASVSAGASVPAGASVSAGAASVPAAVPSVLVLDRVVVAAAGGEHERARRGEREQLLASASCSGLPLHSGGHGIVIDAHDCRFGLAWTCPSRRFQRVITVVGSPSATAVGLRRSVAAGSPARTLASSPSASCRPRRTARSGRTG